MNVRNISTLLWFLAGWSGTGLLVGLTGLPTSWGLLGGLVVAAVIRWEPSGRLWGTASSRRVRPIEELAAELDAKSGVGAPAGERTNR